MRINPEIFREYDIRGVADRDLQSETVYTLGRSIGTYMTERACRSLTVGRDCRLTSDRIRDQLVQGLIDTGLDVIDIGVLPTPVLYYSLYALEPDGAIMITGSHNARDYNGLKMSRGKEALHGDQVQEIRRIAEAAEFHTGSGQSFSEHLLPRYREELASRFGQLSHAPKVVVDAGNGTASILAPDVFRDLGCEVVEMYCDMDGRFPNHHPDPTVVENLQDLVARVASEGADLGVAFDGDADRIGVVDAQGNIIWGDNLMIIWSRDILERHPGATIIGEVKCSMNLYNEIRKAGGQPVMWKAGHSLIKAKMRETGALLAGEMSGHIFFADQYFGYDDATYAGARLLEILSRTGKSVSELLSDVPRTSSTPELRVDVPESIKFEVVAEAARRLGESYPCITVDGVRVEFEDGWGLIRASNTQPALVLRFEATSDQRLVEIRELVENELARARKAVAQV